MCHTNTTIQTKEDKKKKLYTSNLKSCFLAEVVLSYDTDKEMELNKQLVILFVITLTQKIYMF